MIYVLTTDSHSDYKLLGVFEGPDGADVKALAKRWAKEFPEKATNLGDYRFGKEYFDYDHFKEFVMREAGLVPAVWAELWLPNYSLDMKSMVADE